MSTPTSGRRSKTPRVHRISTDDFRQTVLRSFERLEDRDTAQSALQQLHDIADHLELDSLPIFVELLTRNASELASVFARSQIIRLFGLLASLYRQDLLKFVSSIVDAILERFTDGEAEIGEACAEAFGQIVRYTFPKQHSLVSILKPIFTKMQEKHRLVQANAANCLRNVLNEAGAGVLDDSSRLSNAILRQLKRPLCLARAELLEATASLVHCVKERFVPHIESWLPVLFEALKDKKDWNSRRSGVLILDAIVDVIPKVELVPFKGDLLDALEFIRFDKIRQVREIAVETIDKYERMIPNPPGRKVSRWTLSPATSKSRSPSPSFAASSGRKVGKSMEESSLMDTTLSAKKRTVTTSRSPYRETPLLPRTKVGGGLASPEYLTASRRRRGQTPIASSDFLDESWSGPLEEDESKGESRKGTSLFRVEDGGDASIAAVGTRLLVKKSKEGLDDETVKSLLVGLERIGKHQESLARLFESFSDQTKQSLDKLESRIQRVEQKVETMYVQSREQHRESMSTHSFDGSGGGRASGQSFLGETDSSLKGSASFGSSSLPLPHALSSDDVLNERIHMQGGTRASTGAYSRAMKYVHNGDIESAFVVILNEEDSLQMARLLSKIDPTWSPLKEETSICLMEQLIGFVKNDLFLDNALAWMDAGIDEGLALPRDMVKDLLDALHELSSSHSEHGIHAAEIHAKLSESFQKALSFEQSVSD